MSFTEPRIEFSVSGTDLYRATDVIHFFAEPLDTDSYIVTPTLDITNKWSIFSKIFCCCRLEEYRRQLDPKRSADTFRRHLVIVMSSETAGVSQALRECCARACATFNRLIVGTNTELPQSQRIPEHELVLDFERFVLQGPRIGRIWGNKDGATIIIGPGRGMSIDEYDRLFGNMIEQCPTPRSRHIRHSSQPETSSAAALFLLRQSSHLERVLLAPNDPSAMDGDQSLESAPAASSDQNRSTRRFPYASHKRS